MKNGLFRGFAGVLALVFMTTTVWAARQPSKADWEDQVQSYKSKRTVFFSVGGAGLLVGGVLTAMGISQIADADNVPGCSSYGTYGSICSSTSALLVRQQEIDSGATKLYAGIVLGGVGIAGIVLGFVFNGKAKRHQRRGEKWGYAFTPTRDGEGMQLAFDIRY